MINFNKELLEKISSICNELNLKIIIHLKELTSLTDNDVEKIFTFWENINLLNNCSVHDFISIKKKWHKYFNKKDINLLIKYADFNKKNNIDLFLSLINKKYNCILVSDEEYLYKFFDLIKIIYAFNSSDESFDSYKITDCVSANTSGFFMEMSNTATIRKGGLASFNLLTITLIGF